KITGSPAIAIETVTVFGNSSAGGGITNTGTISALATAVLVNSTSTFFGSIINSSGGKIVGGQGGIKLSAGAIFGAGSASGITNNGSVSAGTVGIYAKNTPTFLGSITNGGTISARFSGIALFTV